MEASSFRCLLLYHWLQHITLCILLKSPPANVVKSLFSQLPVEDSPESTVGAIFREGEGGGEDGMREN